MLPRIPGPPPADTDPKGGGITVARLADWLWTSLYFIYVLASLELGMLLLCMPWMRSWENNYLLYLYPQFRPLVSNPFFKGFVLGLGIANIAIGIHEIAQIIRLWKNKRPVG
jgi:hypothetical protein